VSGLAEVK